MESPIDSGGSERGKNHENPAKHGWKVNYCRIIYREPPIYVVETVTPNLKGTPLPTIQGTLLLLNEQIIHFDC